MEQSGINGGKIPFDLNIINKESRELESDGPAFGFSAILDVWGAGADCLRFPASGPLTRTEI